MRQQGNQRANSTDGCKLFEISDLWNRAMSGVMRWCCQTDSQPAEIPILRCQI
jgi:hypothetical protein